MPIDRLQIRRLTRIIESNLILTDVPEQLTNWRIISLLLLLDLKQAETKHSKDMLEMWCSHNNGYKSKVLLTQSRHSPTHRTFTEYCHVRTKLHIWTPCQALKASPACQLEPVTCRLHPEERCIPLRPALPSYMGL